MTYDATDDLQPHGIHPDQHSILTHPDDWKRFLETGDGGIVRSNGNFVDDSAQCARYSPPLTPSPSGDVSGRDEADPGAHRVHQQGTQHAPLLPDDLQPESPRRARRGRAGQRFVDERPGTKTWIETFVADGAFNGFDASIANYSSLSWQNGAIAALWTSRGTSRPASGSPTRSGNAWRDTRSAIRPRGSRVHRADALPSERQQADVHQPGARLPLAERRREPQLPYAEVKEHCNVWIGNQRHRRERRLPAAGRHLRRLEGDGQPRAIRAGSRTAHWPLARTRRTRPGQVWTVACPGAVPVGRGPLRRPRLVERAGSLGRQRRLGGDQRGPDLHHDERGRSRSGIDRLEAGRHDVVGRSASVSVGHLRRPVGSEPRVHHLQRLQPRDAGHAGAHLRGPVQPADGHGDVHVLDGSGPHALGDLPVGIDRAGRARRASSTPGRDFGVVEAEGSRTPVGRRHCQACPRPTFRT